MDANDIKEIQAKRNLSDQEKIRFREFLEVSGFSIEKMKTDLHRFAEEIHHIGFMLMCLENELKTNEERLPKTPLT